MFFLIGSTFGQKKNDDFGVDITLYQNGHFGSCIFNKEVIAFVIAFFGTGGVKPKAEGDEPD